ncbi:MAG: DUF4149 domain-containing protein [Candidatus Limnocylindria bacterium]
METLYFDVIRFGYHLGLALLIGGGMVVGAAAPAVFKTLRSRGEAANVFGAILARYDGMALLALLLVVVTTVLKAGAFEEDLREWRIWTRWGALALMSVAVLYGVAWAGPVARTIRRETPGFDDLPEGDVRRREFRALHRRAGRAFMLVVVFGLVALFFS